MFPWIRKLTKYFFWHISQLIFRAILKNEANLIFAERVHQQNLNNLFESLFSIILYICVLNFKGNTLNLIVFGKKAMRKISTFRFLFYLSASDLLVLTIGATDVLVRIRIIYFIFTKLFNEVFFVFCLIR